MELTNRQKWLRSLMFGLACGVAGVGLVLIKMHREPDPAGLFVGSLYGLASLLSGTATWRLVVAGPGAYRIGRGVASGLLTGLLSHYCFWVLFSISGMLPESFLGSTGGAPADVSSNLLQILVDVLGITVLSVAYAGFETILLAGLVGGGVAFVQGRL